MLRVEPVSNAFQCTWTQQLIAGKEIEVSEAECVISVDLGVPSTGKSMKQLLPDFKKALEAETRHFLASLESDSAALAKVMAKYGDKPADPAKAAKEANSFLQSESANIVLLWKKFCASGAAKSADKALAACLKSARDSEVKALAKTAKGAKLKSSKLPFFKMAAGFISGLVGLAAGGPAGAGAAFSGIAKILLAYGDRSRAEKALKDLAAVEKSLTAGVVVFAKAVAAMDEAIKRGAVEKKRIEREIAAGALEIRKIKSDLATEAGKAEGKDKAAVTALAKKLDAAEKRSIALAGQIVDPAPLVASMTTIKAELTTMVTHARAAGAEAAKAEKDNSDVLKMLKETADALDKLF